MNDLTKIRDVSLKYDISARALKYYEDAGLIKSEKSGDYAYRMFDEVNIKKLEQILILRKLNVAIKDIRRIFEASGPEIVLDVLGEKVKDIDEEIALLYELREIVAVFIKQIREADFNSSSDVKLLYEKAREIEIRLAGAEYTGNPSPVNRLFEVSEKLEQKAVSRLMIPENVMKRLLQNVYFIWGDGAAVADELGRRHGIFVYHTCDHRTEHFQNADPAFQPGLCRYSENTPDFFSRDPQDAMQWECDIVRDYTPMVIMDLIKLSAQYERIICENDIDVESIIPYVTRAVRITDSKNADGFCVKYKNEIRRRDIPREEKERLINSVDGAYRRAKGVTAGEETTYGVKQIYIDAATDMEILANEIESLFQIK